MYDSISDKYEILEKESLLFSFATKKLRATRVYFVISNYYPDVRVFPVMNHTVLTHEIPSIFNEIFWIPRLLH